MKTRGISGLLLCALLCVLLCGTAFSEASGEKILIVNGVDAFESPEGQGWEFDARTGTLILNGYDGGPINFKGFGLTLELAAGSSNIINSDIEKSRTALGADTFGYSEDHLTIVGGEGSSLLIEGDLQGIYAQGDISIKNCKLTVNIQSTAKSEELVSAGTMSSYTFSCVRAGGELLIEDCHAELSSAGSGENGKKTYTGLSSATGRTKILRGSININAASTGIQASSGELRMEGCVLDVRGDDNAAIVSQRGGVYMQGCSGSVVSKGAQGIGVTSQRGEGVFLEDCNLDMDTVYYGIMALAGEFIMQGGSLEYINSCTYGIYAAKSAEITGQAVLDGQDCSFVLYLPAASGCLTDKTAKINGVQLYNSKQDIMIMGQMLIDAQDAAFLSGQASGRSVEFAPDSVIEIEEGALLEMIQAASLEFNGELTNYGRVSLDGGASVNNGRLVNLGLVEQVQGTAIYNPGEAYTLCTARFEAGGNEVKLIHSPGEEVRENILEAGCLEEGSYEAVIYCQDCDEELSREQGVLEAKGHAFGREWVKDDGEHWQECPDCGARNEAGAHEFVWVTDKEASAGGAGLKHEECAVCGYIGGYEEIPAQGTGDAGNILLLSILTAGALAGCLALRRARRV